MNVKNEIFMVTKALIQILRCHLQFRLLHATDIEAGDITKSCISFQDI